MRAYAAIADDMEQAGYSAGDIARIKQSLKHYLDIREIVRKASGETLGLKAYEADMRHLINTYIEADSTRPISPFPDLGLLDLIAKTGIGNAIDTLSDGVKTNKDAVAETIENNVRSKILKEELSDPEFYAKMSALLDEIIRRRREKALDYEEYLRAIADLARQVAAGQGDDMPATMNTPDRRALFNNLARNEGLALQIESCQPRHP